MTIIEKNIKLPSLVKILRNYKKILFPFLFLPFINSFEPYLILLNGTSSLSTPQQTFLSLGIAFIIIFFSYLLIYRVKKISIFFLSIFIIFVVSTYLHIALLNIFLDFRLVLLTLVYLLILSFAATLVWKKNIWENISKYTILLFLPLLIWILIRPNFLLSGFLGNSYYPFAIFINSMGYHFGQLRIYLADYVLFSLNTICSLAILVGYMLLKFYIFMSNKIK